MKTPVSSLGLLILCFLTLSLQAAQTEILKNPVTLSGEGFVEQPADKAVVHLRVLTKDKKLKRAMELNAEIRAALIAELAGAGIPEKSIRSSNFCSTPNAGWFNTVASYEVVNGVSVSVQNESQMRAAVALADAREEITYGGATFEYSAPVQLVEQAIAKACADMNARRAAYEKALGVKLVLIDFSDAGENSQIPSYPLPRYGLSSKDLSRAVKSFSPEDSAEIQAMADQFKDIVIHRKVVGRYRVVTE